MKDQLQTIRSALKSAQGNINQERSYADEVEGDIERALTTLSELEAMVGEREPVAWVHEDDPQRTISAITKAGAIKDGGAIASTTKPFSIPAYATPVAQQPQARPDFADEWTGYLKDGETPFERFLRKTGTCYFIIALTYEVQRLILKPIPEGIRRQNHSGPVSGLSPHLKRSPETKKPPTPKGRRQGAAIRPGDKRWQLRVYFTPISRQAFRAARSSPS